MIMSDAPLALHQLNGQKWSKKRRSDLLSVVAIDLASLGKCVSECRLVWVRTKTNRTPKSAMNLKEKWIINNIFVAQWMDEWMEPQKNGTEKSNFTSFIFKLGKNLSLKLWIFFVFWLSNSSKSCDADFSSSFWFSIKSTDGSTRVINENCVLAIKSAEKHLGRMFFSQPAHCHYINNPFIHSIIVGYDYKLFPYVRGNRIRPAWSSSVIIESNHSSWSPPSPSKHKRELELVITIKLAVWFNSGCSQVDPVNNICKS